MEDNSFSKPTTDSKLTPISEQSENQPENKSSMSNSIKEMMVSMQKFSGPMPNPLLEKIETKHIDKILEIVHEDQNIEYKDRQKERLFKIFVISMIAGLFVFLTIFLATNNIATYKEILIYILTFGGGTGVGFGFGKRKRK
jgi:hypothetical protein